MDNKRKYHIVIKKGKEIIRLEPIYKEEIYIGRHPSNDIVLDDVLVSRRHCKIVVEKENFLIEDLGSKNGTYVNGVKVEKSVLKEGDVINIGIFTLNISSELSGIDDTTKEIFDVGKTLSFLLKDEILKINKFEDFVFRDELTALLNRKAFYHKYKKEIENWKCFAILFVDIDNFKNFNDSYGHKTGDLLLVFISKILKQTLREALIFRWGGEEFVVLLKECNEKEVIKIANDVLRNIRESTKRELKKMCTVSIGIALSERHGQNIEKLIELSDRAMYEAKNKGKNRIEIFK